MTCMLWVKEGLFMRLFYGLSLPPHALAVTREASLRAAACLPGRYTLPENHHITLAFLGNVPTERQQEAEDVLRACVCAFPAPDVTLTQLDFFGRAENAILILRAQASLDGLHESLVRALQLRGLPFDPGPFSPHVTLARHARLRFPLPETASVRFTALQAHLYLSARDDAQVLRYTPIFSVPFQNISI